MPVSLHTSLGSVHSDMLKCFSEGVTSQICSKDIIREEIDSASAHKSKKSHDKYLNSNIDFPSGISTSILHIKDCSCEKEVAECIKHNLIPEYRGIKEDFSLGASIFTSGVMREIIAKVLSCARTNISNSREDMDLENTTAEITESDKITDKDVIKAFSTNEQLNQLVSKSPTPNDPSQLSHLGQEHPPLPALDISCEQRKYLYHPNVMQFQGEEYGCQQKPRLHIPQRSYLQQLHRQDQEKQEKEQQSLLLKDHEGDQSCLALFNGFAGVTQHAFPEIKPKISTKKNSPFSPALLTKNSHISKYAMTDVGDALSYEMAGLNKNNSRKFSQFNVPYAKRRATKISCAPYKRTRFSSVKNLPWPGIKETSIDLQRQTTIVGTHDVYDVRKLSRIILLIGFWWLCASWF